MSVQDVSVISSAQFEAMIALAAQDIPAAQPAPVDPPLPQPIEAAPDPVLEPDPVVEPDAVPAPNNVPGPASVAPEPPAPQLPAPEPDTAVLVPETAPEAVPEQADRVAPVPVARPDLNTRPGEVAQDAIAPSPDAAIVQEPREETAPEAASDRLVSEADTPAAAPIRSARPPSRPNAPAPDPEDISPEPTQTAETSPSEPPEPGPTKDDLADAIAGAVANAQTSTGAIQGPPLTGGELDGLRVSVSQCWNTGTLSTQAQDTKVTVFVAMNRDGTPKGDSIRMIGFVGGNDQAARRVYETARRAILRCGARGFPLPVEKFDQWQEIEMTFNPEGMFWR